MVLISCLYSSPLGNNETHNCHDDCTVDFFSMHLIFQSIKIKTLKLIHDTGLILNK